MGLPLTFASRSSEDDLPFNLGSEQIIGLKPAKRKPWLTDSLTPDSGVQ